MSFNGSSWRRRSSSRRSSRRSDSPWPSDGSSRHRDREFIDSYYNSPYVRERSRRSRRLSQPSLRSLNYSGDDEESFDGSFPMIRTSTPKRSFNRSFHASRRVRECSPITPVWMRDEVETSRRLAEPRASPRLNRSGRVPVSGFNLSDGPCRDDDSDSDDESLKSASRSPIRRPRSPVFKGPNVEFVLSTTDSDEESFDLDRIAKRSMDSILRDAEGRPRRKPGPEREPESEPEPSVEDLVFKFDDENQVDVLGPSHRSRYATPGMKMDRSYHDPRSSYWDGTFATRPSSQPPTPSPPPPRKRSPNMLDPPVWKRNASPGRSFHWNKWDLVPVPNYYADHNALHRKYPVTMKQRILGQKKDVRTAKMDESIQRRFYRRPLRCSTPRGVAEDFSGDECPAMPRDYYKCNPVVKREPQGVLARLKRRLDR